MISFEESIRLVRIQERLRNATFHEIRKDGHHKSSEGAVTLSLVLPPVVGDDRDPYWTVDLWSYVLCPDARSKVFTGRTAGEAISKAEDAAREWCTVSEMEQFERAMGMDEPDEDFNHDHPTNGEDA
jgi:hypothetical protein